ncbi:MAG: sigma-70 family RNA polymerase sigma factor [Acetobacteraceae bacterium]
MAGTGGWLNLAIRTQLNWSNLTAERERELLRTCQRAPDEASRRAALIELWESHSKLVIAIASRYRQTGIELADLIGAGHLGLHAAIARFDIGRFESRLGTYAVGWIRWHIQDYIRRNAAPVRLPATSGHRQLAQMSSRLFADARQSCQRDSIEPTERELCERIGQRIGLSADDVARSMRLITGASASLPSTGPTAGQDVVDRLPANDASPEDDVILRLDHAKARKRILVLAQEILGERERAVFLERCMGDSEDVTHLETLAQRFGVTRERICQLEASAKRKIATALAQEGYAEFVPGEPLRLPTTRARRRPAAAQADASAPQRVALAG